VDSDWLTAKFNGKVFHSTAPYVKDTPKLYNADTPTQTSFISFPHYVADLPSQTLKKKMNVGFVFRQHVLVGDVLRRERERATTSTNNIYEVWELEDEDLNQNDEEEDLRPVPSVGNASNTVQVIIID
jgi:hypothetical protein